MRLLDIPKNPSTPEFSLLPRMWKGMLFSFRQINRSLSALKRFSQQSCLSLLMIIRFSFNCLTVMVSKAATFKSLSSVYVFLRVLMQQVIYIIIPPSHHILEILLKKVDHLCIWVLFIFPQSLSFIILDVMYRLSNNQYMK